jgi:hypothetical protein
LKKIFKKCRVLGNKNRANLKKGGGKDGKEKSC